MSSSEELSLSLDDESNSEAASQSASEPSSGDDGSDSFSESDDDASSESGSDMELELEEEADAVVAPKEAVKRDLDSLKSFAFEGRKTNGSDRDQPTKSRRTASRASAGSSRRSSGGSAGASGAPPAAKKAPARAPKKAESKSAAATTATATAGTVPSSGAGTSTAVPRTSTGTTSMSIAKTGSGAPAAVATSDVGLSMEDEERRQANIAAMLAGDLTVSRNSLMPSLLTVDKDTTTLKKPFKSPFPNASGVSEGLMKALLARKQFKPFSGGKGTSFKMPELQVCEAMMKHSAPYVEPELPPGVEELVLWKSSDDSSQVRVDNMLTKFLRPHQREGVQFLFECVNGLRDHDGCGAILADDMGLGKTLQGITLLWTLLNNGHPELGQEEGGKIAKRIVICCPTSLVSNWDSECTKWLQGRVNTMPIVDASRDEVIDSLTRFCSRANPAQVR